MDRYLQKSGNIACPRGRNLSGSTTEIKKRVLLKDNGDGHEHHGPLLRLPNPCLNRLSASHRGLWQASPSTVFRQQRTHV